MFAEFGPTEMELRALNNVAIHEGDFDLSAGHRINMEGVALARRSGHRGMLLGLIGNVGYSGFVAGDWQAVIPLLDAALLEDLSARDVVAILNNAIIIHAALGDDVSGQMTQLEAAAKDMSGPLFHSNLADASANQALAAGDFATAIEAFNSLYANDPFQLAEYSYRAGAAAILARNLAVARDEMATFASGGGSGHVRDARSTTLGAGIAALDDRQADALPLFKKAIDGWRSVGGVWDEALTGVMAAELLDHDNPEVAEIVASSRAILERLKAKPYLARLDATEVSRPAKADRQRAEEPSGVGI